MKAKDLQHKPMAKNMKQVQKEFTIDILNTLACIKQSSTASKVKSVETSSHECQNFLRSINKLLCIAKPLHRVNMQPYMLRLLHE